MEQQYPEESARRQRVGKFSYRPPGGASWCDVVLRVRQVLLELQERYAGERLWVFSHQATLMSFRVAVEGLQEGDVLAADRKQPLANCSMTTYRPGEDGLELVSYGDSTAVDRAWRVRHPRAVARHRGGRTAREPAPAGGRHPPPADGLAPAAPAGRQGVPGSGAHRRGQQATPAACSSRPRWALRVGAAGEGDDGELAAEGRRPWPRWRPSARRC